MSESWERDISHERAQTDSDFVKNSAMSILVETKTAPICACSGVSPRNWTAWSNSLIPFAQLQRSERITRVRWYHKTGGVTRRGEVPRSLVWKHSSVRENTPHLGGVTHHTRQWSCRDFLHREFRWKRFVKQMMFMYGLLAPWVSKKKRFVKTLETWELGASR